MDVLYQLSYPGGTINFSGAGSPAATDSVRARMENRVWPATKRVVSIAMYPMSQRELLGGRLAGRAFLDATSKPTR